MSRTIGLVLVVLGVVFLAWGGFSYTTSEKVLDIGPIDVTQEKTHSVPLPPLAGAAMLVGGAVLMLSGKKA